MGLLADIERIDEMIWGYEWRIVLVSEGLHILAGLLFLAPFYLMLAGSSEIKGRVITPYGLLLFAGAWLLHILFDGLQNIF